MTRQGAHRPSGPGPGVARDYVADAVRVSGGRGDAVLRVDGAEHARRTGAGVGAVTDLRLLDRLMCLPLGADIAWGDLDAEDAALFQRTSPGIVTVSALGVRRLLVPAVTVDLVVVRQSRWRAGLRAAAAFEPFAQRVLHLPQAPGRIADLLWEADLLGIGVWVGGDDAPEQLLAPAPWRRRYVKAAGWRFAERAYAAWLSASCLPGSPSAAPDRRVRPAAGVAGRLPAGHSPAEAERGG